MTGATHPTPSRRHRSSSSLSTRSIPTPSTSVSGAGSGATNLSTQGQVGSTTSVPIGGVSQASADRAAATRGPQSASGTSTPARQSLDIPRHAQGSHTLPTRPSISREASHTTQSTSSMIPQAGTPFPHPLPSPAQSPSQSVTQAMQHYVETTTYRSEMEIVKAENEALRQRVRALERALRARRRDSSQSDAPRPELTIRSARDSLDLRPSSVTSPASVAAWDGGVGGVAGPRERSESQSTTASSRRGIGLAEDEVRVGESASSIGVGRGF